MTPYQLRATAEDFGISYKSAARMRIRYLVSEWEKGIDWILEQDDMPSIMPNDALNEILALLTSLKVVTHTQLSPDMIERARDVKIDSILELYRGKCHAWCHDDKRPSLTYMSRTNQMWCPVCDKWFDSIAIQQHFTGQSFSEAVKTLCS